ncbi:hypothetical protein BGZ72_010175 [Mortierella alpina]|nr:hypothetical protein BGZ72_010175 [Mortierella alpina]
MFNIVREQLLYQHRLLDLQPRRKDGTYPQAPKADSKPRESKNRKAKANDTPQVPQKRNAKIYEKPKESKKLKATQQRGQQSNLLYRVAPYIQNILDDLAHDNRVCLLRQRCKPAIELSAQHWPRAVVGILNMRLLVTSYPVFTGFLVGYFQEAKGGFPESSELGVGFLVGCGSVALLVASIFGVVLVEQLSNTVLALRWDKPIRHAEFMLKFSRRTFYISSALGMIRFPLSWKLASHGLETDFGPEVLDTVWTIVESGMTVWALRTWVTDLKGEPRTWWGGDKKIEADLEKQGDEKDDSEELKHVRTKLNKDNTGV